MPYFSIKVKSINWSAQLITIRAQSVTMLMIPSQYHEILQTSYNRLWSEQPEHLFYNDS